MNSFITHNRCGCIYSNGTHDERCLKRSYDLFDIRSGEIVTVLICNEYIRLLLHEKRADSNGSSVYKRDVMDVLVNVFSRYVHYSDPSKAIFSITHNDIMDRYIQYSLCQRPRLTSSISFKDALMIHADYPQNSVLTKMIVDEFINYINHCNYKKYMVKYKDAITLSKRLNKSFYFNKNFIIQELLTLLLTLKTK